jgi:hypothetical protein
MSKEEATAMIMLITGCGLIYPNGDVDRDAKHEAISDFKALLVKELLQRMEKGA